MNQIAAWAFGENVRPSRTYSRYWRLVTRGVLPALGGCEPQLEVHINTALNVGLAPQEIVEAPLHSALYSGKPKALNATFVAHRVLGERGLLPQPPDQQQG